MLIYIKFLAESGCHIGICTEPGQPQVITRSCEFFQERRSQEILGTEFFSKIDFFNPEKTPLEMFRSNSVINDSSNYYMN